MSKRRGFDSELAGKFFLGLWLMAAPVVVLLLTDRLFFWLVGVGAFGLYFAANALFSIGDEKNEWE